MAVGWGALQAATQLTTVTTEQFFDDQPQAAPNEFVDVEVDSNSSGSTDDSEFNVYGSLDGGTDFDDTARFGGVIENSTTDPNQIGFNTFGIYQYRVGFKRSAGSTDTFTGDMNHRIGTMS